MTIQYIDSKNSLYQIFYPYNKFDDVQKLDPWFLTQDLKQSFCIKIVPKKPEPINPRQDIVYKPIVDIASTIKTEIVPEPRSQSVSPKPSLTIPDRPDTLFWSVYIFHYGYTEYLAIGKKYGNAELAEKQKIMEHIQKNKYIFKPVNRKITLGASQEIMSELMTNKKTSLLTLNALSIYYKINILVSNKENGTYLEYMYNKDDEQTHSNWLLLAYKNGRYGIVDNETLEDYRKGICIEDFDKPLRGISSYKVCELKELADKIPQICKNPERDSWKKPELYGNIWQACLWK